MSVFLWRLGSEKRVWEVTQGGCSAASFAALDNSDLSLASKVDVSVTRRSPPAHTLHTETVVDT